MAPERIAAGLAPARMHGQALAGSGPLRAGAPLAVRRSGLTRRVAKGLRASGPRARARGPSAGQARDGSPSRASIERARAARAQPGICLEPKRDPRRAGFQNPATRGRRPVQVQSGLVHAPAVKSRGANGLSCGGRFPRRACGTRSPGTHGSPQARRCP